MLITSNNDKLMPIFLTRKIFTATNLWPLSRILRKKPIKTWLLKTIISINKNPDISNPLPNSTQTTKQTPQSTRVYFQAKNVKWLSECFRTVVRKNCSLPDHLWQMAPIKTVRETWALTCCIWIKGQPSSSKLIIWIWFMHSKTSIISSHSSQIAVLKRRTTKVPSILSNIGSDSRLSKASLRICRPTLSYLKK